MRSTNGALQALLWTGSSGAFCYTLIFLCSPWARWKSSHIIRMAGKIILIMPNTVFLFSIMIHRGERLLGGESSGDNGDAGLTETPLPSTPQIRSINAHTTYLHQDSAAWANPDAHWNWTEILQNEMLCFSTTQHAYWGWLRPLLPAVTTATGHLPSAELLPIRSAEGPREGSQKAVPCKQRGWYLLLLLIVPKGYACSQNSFITELNTQTSSVSKQPEEFSK